MNEVLIRRRTLNEMRAIARWLFSSRSPNDSRFEQEAARLLCLLNEAAHPKPIGQSVCVGNDVTSATSDEYASYCV